MPLARIITTSAKYSDGLADDLRFRGFQVLTSAPGDNISESADLEITLNECLAEEARAASDTAETKDMRVFLTPQAFAGKIRSIEMFVLTPKRVPTQKIEMETPGEASTNLTVDPVGKMLEFALPADIVSTGMSAVIEPIEHRSEATTVEPIENSWDTHEESDEPGFASVEEIAPVTETPSPESRGGIGRAILASRQSAWPDMAEMKLVPAELAPASIKPVGMPLPAATLPEKRNPARSARNETSRNKRFWRVPVVLGIAAILALSVFWVANHFSSLHTQAATAPQQITSPSVELAAPAIVVPVNQSLEPTASVVVAKSPRSLVRTANTTRSHASHTRTQRHYTPESDYVAKDTTVYFSRQASASSQKITKR